MEVLEESRNIQIQTYLTTFSLVILFYDHALTFEREVAHIWSQPWIKSSTIFLVNRYLALFSSIATLVLAHSTTFDLRLWHQLMLIVCQILVCIIVSLRIYALYTCSKRVMWFLILFAALLTGVVAWSMTDQRTITSQNRANQECRLSMTFETSVRLSLCWVALFAYDSTLFGLTMYKTWQSKLYRSLATSGSVPILTLLLRDGAVYFMLMALVNMSNILTFYFAPVIQPFMECSNQNSYTFSIGVSSW
ncbi:hypothetical protein DL96DRAFT_1039744 [Flagelloscypha sp. PMI_526]|nr:hypothetical protein DL96DRAFT_1039744 [Flagelloscypha sp. PMI_526]